MPHAVLSLAIWPAPSAQQPLDKDMPFRFLVLAAPICLQLSLAMSGAYASDRASCDRELGVRIGNEGKDVIWVPTHDKLVSAMLQAADTTAQDYVVDLGAGDGKIPIAAAKEFGAQALGIEYDAQMVELAKCYVAAEAMTDQVEIRQADIFETDLSTATVLTMYLLPKINMKLRPAILDLTPGTRVVSNRFKMGRWQPDRVIAVEGVANQAYLWIVPARIAGRWRFEEQAGLDRFHVRFEQRFQVIEGTVLGRERRRIENERLRGTQLEFTLSTRNQTVSMRGSVQGDVMQLTADRDGASVAYVGKRLPER
jgi:hypothetical protein